MRINLTGTGQELSPEEQRQSQYIQQLEHRRVPTADTRQLAASERWAFYEDNQYQPLKYDWDGRPIADRVDKVQEAVLTIRPQSFNVEPDTSIPWTQRRPVVTAGLAGMIVDRFTSLLFSQHNQPILRVEPEGAQPFIDAVIEQSQWWEAWRQARTYGGATGTAVVSPRFENGQIKLDVFDTRFVIPTFENRDKKILSQLEILYQFEVTERTTETRYGSPIEVSKQVKYYYRRVITPEIDIVFKPLVSSVAERVGVWTADSVVWHNMGFVPAIWIQNLPIKHDVDGKCDFEGTQNKIIALDAQLSQAHNSILYNADPTLIIRTELEVGKIRKGSRSAIVLEQGGDAHYLEMNAGGPKAALELAERLENAILQQCAVVLHPGTGNMTAEEVKRRFEAMYDKADILRAQYGKAMIDTMNMIRQMTEVAKGNGFAVDLPEPYPEKIDIEWPHYVKESEAEHEAKIRQIVMAKSSGLLPEEYAARMIAELFGVEDIESFIAQLPKPLGLEPPIPRENEGS